MTYTIEGTTAPWEVVVGLEVHAQVISASKLFSGAATTFGAEPNEQVSFVDAAFPGMLPVPNVHCVAQAVRTGLGLKAHINLMSRFDRKNYFYADLPAGYQISQYEKPIVGAGSVEIVLGDFSVRTIGITRLHLEQDAGKSLHDQHSTKSYIDLNRAGVALMEIVSEPDIRSPEEAAHFLQKLRTIMRYLGTCDGNMEEGSLRADVNVSVRRPGEAYRTRCEIKNVNSVRFVMQAIDAEARRQKDIWESGGTVQQETRLFDPASGTTRPMRSKEDAHDYRYFPDPDLPPLVLEEAWVEELRRTLPELPDAKRARLESYGLTPYQAAILVSEREVVEHYESAVPDSGGSVELANLYIGPIAAIAKREGLRFEDIFRVSKLAPASTASIAKMIVDQIINRQVAPRVLEITLKTGEDPITIVEARGWRQEKDTAAIDAAVAAVLAANPDKVAEYRAGKEKMFGFFVGQVMREMKGKGNPALVNAALRERLGA